MNPARRLLTLLKTIPLVMVSLTGCSQLGLFNALAPHDAGTRLVARDVAYGTDPRQRLDIYAPVDGQGRSAVVVFVYGGSWNSGRRQEYAFAARALASRGYVTVLFDYRLVPEHRYPVFVEDTAKAVAWTHRNVASYGGDPARLFILGHSAGAYNAVMTALAPEFLAAEGLDPSVVRGVAGLSGPYDFLPLDVDATREVFRDVADLEATQPVNRIGGSRGPAVFVATGEADTLVKPRNTRALDAALRRAGRRVEARYYDGVDHAGTLLALSRALRGRAPVLDDVTGFFRGL
jgi:acetyl esterase/lipase